MIKPRYCLVDNFAINNELMCGKSGECITRKMTAEEKIQYKNKPAKTAFAFGAIGRDAMSNSISLCSSCAAPMCKWLLKMEICKGMEVVKED